MNGCRSERSWLRLTHHSFDRVGTAFGAPRGQKPAAGTEGESAGTQCFRMIVDELLAGVRRETFVAVAGPLVRDMPAGSEVKMPSLDVLVLQIIEALRPQAPLWVPQMDVLAPPEV